MSVFVYAYPSPLGYVVMGRVEELQRLFFTLHTKRVRLNKVAKHEKKYLLNCSVRIYQRIIKLKYRASRYLSMFSCNKPVCLL